MGKSKKKKQAEKTEVGSPEVGIEEPGLGMNEPIPGIENMGAIPGVAGNVEDMNMDLLDRVRELETELADRESDDGLGDFGEEGAGGSFFSVVRDLETEIDAALSLKDSLEADLEDTREKLAEEVSVRNELESRIKLLESQAALADQLRQELSFVEEERDRSATVLAETQTELDSVTDERNALTEKLATSEAENRRLQNEKTDLDVQLSTLEDKVTELEPFRGQFEQASRECDVLEEKVQDLRRSLETSNNMTETLKSDVATSRELVKDLRAQIEDDRAQIDDTKEELAATDAELTQTSTKLDAQLDVNRHLGGQIKTLTEKYRFVWAELDGAKKAMRSLHRASARVRERTGRTGRRAGA